MQLLKLTEAEKVLLSRRRLFLSRNKFAKKYGMTVYRLNKIEKGFAKKSKLSMLITPELHEIAYVLRKRSYLKVIELAALMKVSKQTILNREANRRNPQPNIDFLNYYVNKDYR
tara:strand:+ start:1361 stop:1702 length:342 start_codon:yes stop_codon:yes gene_type:complete